MPDAAAVSPPAHAVAHRAGGDGGESVPPSPPFRFDTKDLSALFSAAFWDELRPLLMRYVLPQFTRAFMVGAALGADQAPVRGTRGLRALGVMLGIKADPQPGPDSALPFDFEAVSAASSEVIGRYSDTWWRQFSAGTQSRMRAIVQESVDNGLTMPQTISRMTPLFGAQRARLIAVSETTTLMGMGAQETYRRAGFSEWEWRTVRDSRVDPICRARDRQRYSMSMRFERAHPGCRCWPVPAGEPGADPGPESTQPLPPVEVPPSVRALEAEIEQQTYETAILIDRESGEVVFRKSGDVNSVDFDRDELALLRGRVLTHNHPTGRSLSITDMDLLRTWDIDEVRVIGSNGMRYSARLTNAGKELSPSEFHAAIKANDRIVANDFWAEIRAGRLTRDQAEAQHAHRVWTLTSSGERPIITYRAQTPTGGLRPAVVWPPS